MRACLAGALIATLMVTAAHADGTAPRSESTVGAQPQNWTGLYLGGEVGYAWGGSDWSARGVGETLEGSFSLFHPFDAFKGTGSYFAGFQAGYNYRLPSGIVIGGVADFAAPNSITDHRTIASPGVGQASLAETVELSGTLRGRVGFVEHDWLFYATAGYAWSYDQFVRTQLVGTPAGGTAGPGALEKASAWRNGWSLGAGVELPVAKQWTASFEYLFTSFPASDVTFPLGAQRFDSDLDVHSLRVGLNYQFGDGSISDRLQGPTALRSDDWSVHGQSTFTQQYAFPFHAPYRGPNSLDSNAGRETWDVTFYVGWRPWSGAEVWINPEIDQGFGLSGTVGVAAFTSGEAYKVGANFPYARMPRYFLRQTIDLGGQTEKIEDGINQFAGSQTADRLVITAGKFASNEIFDTNKYAHDPRIDFLNWAIVDTGTFDYAADAWAFTYGLAAEWYKGPWTLRVGLFDLPIVPNSTDLDPRFAQVQWIGEIERRYKLLGQPGKLAVTAFLTRGRMGRFEDAVALAEETGEPADIAAVRHYQSRTGVGFNLEQQISSDLGFFARGGVADGSVEPFAFTDIDKTIAAGLALKGTSWGRADDTLGLAGVASGISRQHQAFFDAGGLGILAGDGKLPHPGVETVIETYYAFPLSPAWRASLDYQFVCNPAFNEDRGPVSVVATRLRTQF
jgi:high affinity Mn2+ porin